MQVKELETAGLKRTYQITVPASTIAEQVDVELKEAGKTLKIPGFRPGFVPLKILQQRFGKSVEADVLKSVIQRSTGEMINEQKIRPALAPEVAVDSYEEGKDLQYTVSVETFPDVPDVAFDQIKLTRKVYEIDEKETDDALTRIAERSPALVPAEKTAKTALGNVVVIDFAGKIDGVAFDGGTAEGFRLELGSKQFIGNFEEQLVDKKIGDEVLVKVSFPDDYGSENLAGKASEFDVKIHEILVKETPAIDDDFATARGLENVAALRAAVNDQLKREYDGIVRTQLKKALFDELDETVEFQLPEGMVEMEFKSIWERLKQAQAQGDESLAGKSDDELKEEYREISERRVKLGIMLAEVGNKNQLKITREEMTSAVMEQARMFPGQEQRVFEFYKNNPDRMEDLRGPIMEEKAVDFILAKVSFTDEKVTVEALVKSAEEDDANADKPKKSKTKNKTKK